MNKRRLAHAIKRFRMEQNWTLVQLAQACDLNPRTIWNLEHEKVKPHDRTIAKIQRTIPEVASMDLLSSSLITWGDESAD